LPPEVCEISASWENTHRLPQACSKPFQTHSRSSQYLNAPFGHWNASSCRPRIHSRMLHGTTLHISSRRLVVASILEPIKRP
jgi:hypothetical protein